VEIECNMPDVSVRRLDHHDETPASG
jgi:hypothetical protein